MPKSSFLDAAEMMALNFETLDDELSISFWRCLLRSLIGKYGDGDGDVRSADIICKLLSSTTSLESKKAKTIFEQLNFLCTSLLENMSDSISDEVEKLERILGGFVREADSCLTNLDLSKPTCPFKVCHFSVKKLCRQIATLGADSLHRTISSAIADWPTRVRASKRASGIVENETDDLLKAIESSDNLEFIRDNLDGLVEILLAEYDETVATFVGSRYNQLTRQQVTNLMPVNRDVAYPENCEHILKICLKTFSSWNLEVQDAYREEFHKRHGLKVYGIDSIASSHERLTDIVNRISSDERDADSIIGDLSRLCLTHPIETVKILVEHAIKRGQISSVAKILYHLRGTCCAAAAGISSRDGSSLLTHTLETFVVVDDDDELSASMWNNCKDLIEEVLIRKVVIDAGSFLRNFVANFLVVPPSNCCWRILQVLRVMLRSEIDTAPEMWTNVDLSATLFLVGQILDDCTTTAIESVTFDRLKTKEEAHNLLGAFDEFLTKHPELMSADDRIWLAESKRSFHPAVTFRLRFVVGGGGGDDGQTNASKDFEDKSIEDLLQMASISKEAFDSVVHHMLVNSHHLNAFADNNRRLRVALLNVLAKLTAAELRASMDLLVVLRRNVAADENEGHHHELAIVNTIRDVSEILMVVVRFYKLQSAAHEFFLIQNLMTTIKSLLDIHGPMQDDNLINVLATVARLSASLAVGCNPESQSIIKLLMVDIVKLVCYKIETEDANCLKLNWEYRCYVIMAIVRALNDDVLIETVQKLITSKNESHLRFIFSKIGLK